jgi:flagellar hook-associated protein 2
MGSILSFSGLASGVQWRDLVDQIIAVERAPADRLQAKIDAAKLRSTAWSAFQSHVTALRGAASTLATTGLRNNRVTTTAAGATLPLSASATLDATPGTHTVKVLGLATAEVLGGDDFAARTTALGLAGELRIGGVRVEITATESLDTIVQKLNDANAGGATGVTASVLTTGLNAHRLVLTSTQTGAAGIDLVDGASGVLRSLGLLDATVAIKTATSNGAQSDSLADASSTIASLLGYTSPPAAGTVTMGGVNVDIDLSTMSLTDVAGAINTAAALAGRGVTASVIDDGSGKRLDIRGATSYTDSNRILESLGVLEGGRGAVAEEIRSAALGSAAATPATTGTLLTGLWSGGAAANVQAGDTFTISGTRGDGSAFAFDYTVAGGDTVQTLLDRLNSAVDGLQSGSRTATASLSVDGEIVITDDTGGDSRLALSIVANNQGGGALDFGAFGTTVAGRARTISAGADAQLEVNGSYLTRTTNSVSDVVAGVTFALASADPNTTVTVAVARDIDASVAAVTAMVDAYNKLADFVDAQLTPPAEGESALPLYNDSSLRSMRSALRASLSASLDATVTGGLSRLSEIGIEIDRQGRYTIDNAKLKAALENSPTAVSRLFQEYGTATASGASFFAASSKTVPGTYALDITQAAAAAAVTGAGFGGTYVDDGTADTITIRDISTSRQYAIALANGMTLSQIVDAINLEFATPLAHTIGATTALYSDAGGTTPADDATLWSDVRYAGGTNPAVAVDDVITIAGTRTDGSTFLTSIVIGAGGTLGQLRSAVQSVMGADVDVAWQNGQLTATAKTPGSSSFTLSVTSDNAGGGTFDLGAFNVSQQGRGTIGMVASDDGGQLRLAHNDYGSTAGFEVSFTAGGADGSASLGLAAGSWLGVDVAGTIGGFAATGSGRILTGAASTAVEGLLVRYDGTLTGALGTVTYSRGLAQRLLTTGDFLLGSAAGSIKDVVDRIDFNVANYESRITTLEARLDRRSEELIRRFTAMEQAIARANSQSAWLEAQFNQLNQMNNRNNR